jgi:hypothetical protein
MTLRQHMIEMHPNVKLPRLTADLIKVHKRQHHRYFCSHFHAGSNTGPDDRPTGWATGESPVPRKTQT